MCVSMVDIQSATAEIKLYSRCHGRLSIRQGDTSPKVWAGHASIVFPNGIVWNDK